MPPDAFVDIIRDFAPEPPKWVLDIARVAVRHLATACAAIERHDHDRFNGEVNGLLAGVIAWAAYEIGESATDDLGRALLAEAKRLHDAHVLP